MTHIKSTPPRRRRISRPLLAASGCAALVVAGSLAWVQSGAGADPVSTDVAGTCSLGGSNVDVTVPMTVDDVVDPVAPGGTETLHVDQDLGKLPVEVTVNKVVVTTPIPVQVASTDSVSFEGGNMAGSFAIDGTNLVVTFTGPQSSSQLQFPRVVVHQTISDTASGTIEWKVWSSMATDTNYGMATCTPKDPTTNLNTTKIAGGSGGSTTTTTTPGSTSTTTTPGSTSTTVRGSGSGGATATTTSPGTDPGSSQPGAAACVKIDSPLPLPTGSIPCPITIPQSGTGGLPIPAPPAGGGLPIPAPPLPTGGGLPLPSTGESTVESGFQMGVSSSM